MRDISAIVVTHNSESELGACLDALRDCGQKIVVDNASADGTLGVAAERTGVEVIANVSNRGFAAAVNQGAASATGRYLLLVNPDAVLATGCGPLREACERSGLAAGCLINQDGRPQAGFTVRRLPSPAALILECLGINRVWPGNPINARYRYLDLDLTQPGMVEQPAGALLMVRRDVFKHMGGMDERFWPVWYEDVDFCRRAREAGYLIEYTPAVRALHSGAHSVRRMRSDLQRLYWYGSLLRYVDKHYRPFTLRAMCCAIALGALLRWPAAVMYGRHDSGPGEISSVLRLAAASFLAGRLVCPAAAGGTAGQARIGSNTGQIRQVVDEN